MSLDLELVVKKCDCCGRGESIVWERSPTYNLGPMWREAEIPFSEKRIEGQTAASLHAELARGLDLLRGSPGRFRALAAENGWGTYEDLIEVVETMVAACLEYPNAVLRVHR